MTEIWRIGYMELSFLPSQTSLSDGKCDFFGQIAFAGTFDGRCDKVIFFSFSNQLFCGDF
jgi:hypothetical protein